MHSHYDELQDVLNIQFNGSCHYCILISVIMQDDYCIVKLKLLKLKLCVNDVNQS